MNKPSETRQWWRPPELHREEEAGEERRVSWLELFYDLVFVVVVAELAHGLAADVSVAGMERYVLLFIPVWWVWIGSTIYSDRFEANDLSFRVFTFAMMLPVAALAVFAPDALGATSVGFALAYAASRLILITMWARAGRHNREARPLTNRYSAGFSVSVGLFLLSVFVPPPTRFVLWGVALLVDLVTPVTTLEIQKRLPSLSTSKLPERFGLFTIIVLGEAVVGTVQGVTGQHDLTVLNAVVGALGIALAFGMWWLYFDYIAQRDNRSGVWWRLAWSYLHLPLVMSVAATGAGVQNVVAHPGAGLPDEVRWLLCGAVALSLITVGLLEFTLAPEEGEPTNLPVSVGLKFGAGLAALALGAWGTAVSAVALLGLLLALLLVPMVYGAVVWFSQPLSEAANAS